MAVENITDEIRLNFIEEMVRRSSTGASFDWIPSVDGERSGFRFMTYHNIREPFSNVRASIDAAILQMKAAE